MKKSDDIVVGGVGHFRMYSYPKPMKMMINLLLNTIVLAKIGGSIKTLTVKEALENYEKGYFESLYCPNGCQTLLKNKKDAESHYELCEFTIIICKVC